VDTHITGWCGASERGGVGDPLGGAASGRTRHSLLRGVLLSCWAACGCLPSTSLHRPHQGCERLDDCADQTRHLVAIHLEHTSQDTGASPAPSTSSVPCHPATLHPRAHRHRSSWHLRREATLPEGWAWQVGGPQPGAGAGAGGPQCLRCTHTPSRTPHAWHEVACHPRHDQPPPGTGTGTGSRHGTHPTQARTPRGWGYDGLDDCRPSPDPSKSWDCRNLRGNVGRNGGRCP
jgi:hypothetical protein